MKKLLLVMLVPILVLGMIGCGKSKETGDEIPYALHGTWVTGTANAPYFVFSANEMIISVQTVLPAPTNFGWFQLAFNAVYTGPKNDFDKKLEEDGKVEFSVKITRILDGVEWGTYKFVYTGATDTITLQDEGDIKIADSVLPYYEYNHLLDPDANYNRATQ
jgi:hypothetical protein